MTQTLRDNNNKKIDTEKVHSNLINDSITIKIDKTTNENKSHTNNYDNLNVFRKNIYKIKKKLDIIRNNLDIAKIDLEIYEKEVHANKNDIMYDISLNDIRSHFNYIIKEVKDITKNNNNPITFNNEINTDTSKKSK